MSYPLVWFVTGCTSGLGEQFVESIIARGDRVIATGRDISRLKKAQEAGADILQLNVTSALDSIRSTIQQAINIHGRIDVLVNNAGYIQVGTVEETSYEDYLSQFDTNVFGSIKVTQALLPHFCGRKSGTNVFIGSLSGWIGHEFCSPYAGSKFALEGIVESLHRETAHLGIKTLLVEPGRFRTKLLSGSNRRTRESGIHNYADISNEKSQGLAAEDGNQPGDPARLVSIVLDLVRREGVGKDRDIPLRMPLGIDCFEDIKAKCDETLQLLNAWEDVIKSTDHDR